MKRVRFAPVWALLCLAVVAAFPAESFAQAARSGAKPDPDVLYPTVEDGVKGVAFVEACVKSSSRNAAWVSL